MGGGGGRGKQERIIRQCNFLKNCLKIAGKKTLKVKKAEDSNSVLTRPGHPQTICNMIFYNHVREKKHQAGKIPKLVMKESKLLAILTLPELPKQFW